MIRPRTAALAGAAASVVAIAVTMLSSDAVRAALARAYVYPNDQGLDLDEAASMTLTYLFAVGGAALVVAVLYLLARPLFGSRGGWWLGAVLALLGLAVAVYDATQEFPVAVKVAFFLPPLAGVLWLALARPETEGEAAAAT